MGTGQENNEEKVSYCPNTFFNNGTISIGEFKTIDEAMNFPIKEIWCINRTVDNKYQAYKSQGTRILIICNWNKSIQDPTKFVVALVFKDGEIKYFDMNDLPLYPEERKNQYEGSLGDEATYTLYHLLENKVYNNNTKMNKKLIRLTESDLHRIVKESVNKVLNESEYDHNADYLEAKQIIDGMDFQDVINLPHKDKRFSFGSLNGSEGEGMVDLNFKGILLTVRAVAKVVDDYEKYDKDGSFIGLSNH